MFSAVFLFVSADLLYFLIFSCLFILFKFSCFFDVFVVFNCFLVVFIANRDANKQATQIKKNPNSLSAKGWTYLYDYDYDYEYDYFFCCCFFADGRGLD